MIDQPVHIEETATTVEVEAVRAAFARAGFDVEVVADYSLRARGGLPWIIELALTVPVSAFFAAFGAEAGKDAYAATKRWVKDVIRSRAGSNAAEGTLHLVDSEHTHLKLDTGVPDEAIDAARDIDWDSMRGGYLFWSTDRKEWVNADRRGPGL